MILYQTKPRTILSYEVFLIGRAWVIRFEHPNLGIELRRGLMKHTPKPGAYRELFKSGLIALLSAGELSEQERKDAEHYLLLLDDPNCKFGRIQPISGYTDFFRS